ncbi:MAG: BTAD domain-containing putative transcriptional regulator [Halanaerobiales bacterium]
MVKINNTVLKAFTLGKFLVRKGNKVISKQKSDSLNLWLLFQYLLSHPNTLIPREQVIDELNFDMKLIDAKNALENRIYRLRKLLAADEQYQTDKYVVYEQGNYGLNWNKTCWSDTIEFEKNCKKGEEFLQEKEKQAALDRLIKALEVYKGDYLENLANYQWAVTRRVKYRQMYLDIFNKTCNILTELKEYQTIEKFCRQAIEIDPFEERAHYILIKTLLKRGHKREARSHYNVVKTLFDKQEDFFQELNKIIKQKQRSQHFMQEDADQEEVTLDHIKEELNLNIPNSGINTVSVQDFRRQAQFIQKKCHQENIPLFLASIALKFNKSKRQQEQEKRFAEDLKSTFENSLRSSDIVCQWTRQQFLILLPSVQASKVQKILERIKNKFYELEEDPGSIINVRYQKL